MKAYPEAVVGIVGGGPDPRAPWQVGGGAGGAGVVGRAH